MQIYRVSYRTRGFVRLARYALRWAYMVTNKAKHRARVLAFWHKHGLTAATEAFQVSERTLYNWQANLKQGGGQLEALNNKSTAPRVRRVRRWPEAVVQEIRNIRSEHPNLGKDKIHVFLSGFCRERQLRCPSISTIGNLIRDLGGLRIFPKKVSYFGRIKPLKRAKVLRKPKDFKAFYPGHCGSFDTIERIIHGSRRYILTFTDVFSRFSLAWATGSHASQAATEFFDLVKFLFPFPFAHILTDNGSEFSKHFSETLKRLHLTHWHTYPKTPKMNTHCERFNRSIQEEYVDYHAGELLSPETFNRGLMKYLLWYNTERPHFGLKLQTPVRFITQHYPQDCKTYLTNTAC